MSARPACSEAERGQALPVGALRRLWALWVVEIIPQPSRARWRSGHGHSSNYINSKTSRLHGLAVALALGALRRAICALVGASAKRCTAIMARHWT
jgi:hypothetical protein